MSKTYRTHDPERILLLTDTRKTSASMPPDNRLSAHPQSEPINSQTHSWDVGSLDLILGDRPTA